MNLTEVNHCFPINGNINNPLIAGGIDKVLEAYQKSLRQIGLAGPTLFGPVLEWFYQHVKEQVDGATYYILMMITDGDIQDMVRTKDMIVKLSHEACSIVIIGVGDGPFN